jgi:cystathionine beta-synthase
MPVAEGPEGPTLGNLVGSISEKGLLERAYRDPGVVERTVGEVMDPPLPVVQESGPLDEVFLLLERGVPAVLAARGERPIGVITKLDVLEYLSHHPRLGL